jgi:predicted phage gp36 major capsid-like protein
MATTDQPTTSELTELSSEEDDALSPLDEAVSRFLDDHTLALLRVLADAGDAWGANPEEQRLVSGLVGAETPRSPW